MMNREELFTEIFVNHFWFEIYLFPPLSLNFFRLLLHMQFIFKRRGELWNGFALSVTKIDPRLCLEMVTTSTTGVLYF